MEIRKLLQGYGIRSYTNLSPNQIMVTCNELLFFCWEHIDENQWALDRAKKNKKMVGHFYVAHAFSTRLNLLKHIL